MIIALEFLLSVICISVISAQNPYYWNGNQRSVNSYQNPSFNNQPIESLETKVRENLWIVLRYNAYPREIQEAQKAFAFFESKGYIKKLCENTSNQYQGNLQQNIKEYIDEFKNRPRDDERQTIKEQVARQFPKLSQRFRSLFENLDENTLNILKTNKQEFQRYLEKIARNSHAIKTIIEVEIYALLEQEFNTFKTNDEFEDFKEQCRVDNHFNYGILFDYQSLNDIVSDCKKRYVTARNSQAYYKIVQTLNSQYPNSHDGNKKFVDFLWISRVDLVSLTSDVNNFWMKIDFHLKQYEQQKKLEFDKWTASKFTKSVESNPTFNQPEFHPATPRRKANDEFVTFTSTFRPQQTPLLHSTTQFSTTQKTLNPDDIFNQCLIEVYNDIGNLVDGKFLKEDNCLLARICEHRTLVNNNLEAQVENYFGERKINGKKNILDEVDETIYDVIKNLLTAEKLEKVQAYIFFLKKMNFINAKYNPELLFDNEELLKLLTNQHFKCFF